MIELTNFGLFHIKDRNINIDSILLCTKTQFNIDNYRIPTTYEIYCQFALTNNGVIIKE